MIKYNNNVLKVNNKWLKPEVDPYNPLNLPPYTIRLRFADGYLPSFQEGTATQVSSTPNVWDLTYENSDWEGLLFQYYYLEEVLGANTTNVTNMFLMFNECSSLTTVALFDTSNVTDTSYMFNECTSLISSPLFNTSNDTTMAYMFYNCNQLTSVPLFDTSNVTDMDRMFYGCTWVSSGAFALYQQASNQTNPPTDHHYTFYNCGANTQTGSAELAQIPSDWGGTGA